MSNYTQSTFFTPKDSLPVSNPAKTIFGAAYDTEFGNISTAIASKPDVTTIGTFLGVAVTGNSLTTNGLYLPAANTLGFTSNTTQRATVNATGNWVFNAATAGITVNINGGGPSNALQISNLTSTTSNPSVQLLANGGGAAVLSICGNAGAPATADFALLQNGTGGAIIQNRAAQTLTLGTNNVVQLTFASGGGLTVGAAADQGAGTLNALTQLYVNAVPVYRTGTFTGTLTGMTGATTGTVTYTILGTVCTLEFAISGTSNTTALTMTGLPAVCQPVALTAFNTCQVTDSGTNVVGAFQVPPGVGTITFHRQIVATGVISATGFTNSGTKGLNTVLTYSLL